MAPLSPTIMSRIQKTQLLSRTGHQQYRQRSRQPAQCRLSRPRRRLQAKSVAGLRFCPTGMCEHCLLSMMCTVCGSQKVSWDQLGSRSIGITWDLGQLGSDQLESRDPLSLEVYDFKAQEFAVEKEAKRQVSGSAFIQGASLAHCFHQISVTH